MHRERVERHCKGVTTSLNEFKARFQQMVEEHDKEVSQEPPCQMSINGYVSRGSVVEDLTNKLPIESNVLISEMKHRTSLNVELKSFTVKVTCFLFLYAALTSTCTAVNCKPT